MLEHVATPAFTNYNEVRVQVPETTSHFDKEWIWVRFHVVRIPITVVLVPNYNFTIQEIFSGVAWYTVNIESLKLLSIWLHDLRPSLPVIKMNSIDTVLLSVLHDLIDKKLPGLQFSIVEHGCVLKLLRLSISSITDVSSTILIQVMQKQILIFSMMTT